MKKKPLPTCKAIYRGSLTPFVMIGPLAHLIPTKVQFAIYSSMGSLQDLFNGNWWIFHFHDGKVYWKWRNCCSLHYCDILPRCTIINQLDHRDHTLFLFFSRLQIGTQGCGILKSRIHKRKLRENENWIPKTWTCMVKGAVAFCWRWWWWWLRKIMISANTTIINNNIHPFTSRIANGKWWWKRDFLLWFNQVSHFPQQMLVMKV